MEVFARECKLVLLNSYFYTISAVFCFCSAVFCFNQFAGKIISEGDYAGMCKINKQNQKWKLLQCGMSTDAK